MKTTEILFLIASLLSGVLLGLLFFGGLWFTIKKMLSSKMPGLLFMASFFIRTAMVLSGFYVVSGADIKRLLFCTGGFLIARIISKKYFPSAQLKKENA